jgi:hypothetical protein
LTFGTTARAKGSPFDESRISTGTLLAGSASQPRVMPFGVSASTVKWIWLPANWSFPDHVVL